jgi:hypothetical protein
MRRPTHPVLGSSHSEDHNMGFLDELKDKAEEFGEKAKEGFGAGKDDTEEVIENVKDRFDGDAADATAQESAASSVDEALGAQEAAADRRADSI